MSHRKTPVMKSALGYVNQGKLIRESRMKWGLTQTAISNVFGYTSPQFISNWERGISGPSEKTARKLCRVLQIPPEIYFEAFRKDYMVRQLKRTFFGYKLNTLPLNYEIAVDTTAIQPKEQHETNC